LAEHPEVFMSRYKEPFYYCKDFHAQSDNFHGYPRFFPIRTEDQYLALFRQATGRAVVGESSTGYLYSKVALGEIARSHPDAKILISLRRPLDFIISRWKENVFCGYERRRHLLEALRPLSGPEELQRLAKEAPCPAWLDYRAWLRYPEQLQRCFALFPREQVKVVLFEEFRQDNRRVLSEVFRWLNVSEEFLPKLRDVNKIPDGYLSPLAQVSLRPWLRRLGRKLIPLPLHDTIWQAVRFLFWRSRPIRPEERRSAAELLREEIQAAIEGTSEILGRDLYPLWAEKLCQ
jgi:hypothetical protein